MNAAPHLLTRFSDNLSAGFPSPAEGYEDEPLDLHDWIVRRPASTFFYRVSGDQLREQHIRDGSLLVVDRSVTPRRGDLILCERAGSFAIVLFSPDRPIISCGIMIACVTRFRP